MKMARLKKQKGVGLVEVMIALLVLAIGVLGYAGMQLTALKSAEDASYRAQATLIAQDALERFLANEIAMSTYLDVENWPEESAAAGEEPGAINDCIKNSCAPADMAEWDIELLGWQAANLLPAGMISVDECKHAATISCVAVSWNGQLPDDCMTNDGVNTDEGTACLVLEVAR